MTQEALPAPELMSLDHRPISRGSMIIAATSTVVEWYDFTLYLYFATVLARLFFGNGADALATTLGAFAVAYLMRPLGALLFGHVGDRFGRRRMMLISMALMTVAMLATALLPTRAAVGPIAGWLLMLLRCVMGFSVGGEYTGVVAYLLEGAPAHRRGLITSLAAGASEVGALLAVAVSAATVSLASADTLANWAWRVPFLVGAALAGSIWIARSAMHESPEFERQLRTNTVPTQPLAHAFAHHRGAIARGFAISALGSITYYVGITYVPAFLAQLGKIAEAQALWLSTVAAVAVILVTPVVGWLSDRFGRKPVLIAVGIASTVLPISLFTALASGSALLALPSAILLACVAGAVSAVGAVATAELIPGEGRLTGLALGATGATALFGGVTPWLAQRLLTLSGRPEVPGIMIAVVGVVVLPILLRLPETRPSLPPP